MTLSMSIMLGLMMILFAWRKREIEYPQSSRPAGSRGGYCLCFYTASLYPNTSFNSHPEAKVVFLLGIAPP